MPQELIQFDTRKWFAKIVFLLVIGVAGVWSVYAVRWFIGDTMAEYFNTEENDLELAQIAQRLAPNDPLTHWRLGQVSQQKLPLDQAAAALPAYEQAVALSPNDYRLWMSLGIARERTGEAGKAEPAFRQAVALAPSYAYPHWHLGNLLLRSGRYDEAFAELRTAGESAEELNGQFFNLVYEVYGGDLESIKRVLGSKAVTLSQFALYLLGRQKNEEAIAMWNSLSNDEKKANKLTGDSIIGMLLNNSRFRDATVVWNDLAANESYRIEEGRITDGGFEETITYSHEAVFGWQVKTTPHMQIGIDPQVGHGGQRSLRLLFQVRTQLDSINVSQLVPVTAATTYDFEYFVKTAKLQSGGPPVIQVVDAATGEVLASSEAAPNGDSEWNRVALNFKTTNKTEAVRLSIVRASCGETSLCPIFGTVWYDDFSFKRHN
jgi:hypothetical protein